MEPDSPWGMSGVVLRGTERRQCGKSAGFALRGKNRAEVGPVVALRIGGLGMSDVSHEASTGESESEFPRFLNRDQPEQPSHLQPPPLPRPPLRRGVSIVRFAGATTLCAIAIASAPLLTAKRAPEATAVTPPAGRGLQRELHDDIADAVEIVAALESRLSFGANLPAQSSVPGADTVAGLNVEDTRSAESDPLAVMLMRALPEAVAFPAAAPIGVRVWGAAARNAETVLMSIGGGAEPVISDSEILARSDFASGADVLPQSADGGASEREPVKAAAASADGDTAAKPVKRQRVHVRKVATVAHDVPRSKRRVRHGDDAYKARNNDPSPVQKDASTAELEPEKPAGPISKFFAWLKGGAKKTPAEDDTSTGFGLAPQD